MKYLLQLKYEIRDLWEQLVDVLFSAALEMLMVLQLLW